MLNRQSTGGRNPVHLVATPDNQALVVANHATGTIALLPRVEDGSLGPVQQLEVLPGTPGPHKVDQTASHPHEIAYDRQGRFMLVPDKGLGRSKPFNVAAKSAGISARFLDVELGFRIGGG